MKVFNNPHFHLAKGSSSSKSTSLQSSRVGNNNNSNIQNQFTNSVCQGTSEVDSHTDFNEMLGKLNALQVAEEPFDILQEMQALKGRIMTLLKKYQVLLQGEQAKNVKIQIKSDVQDISNQYQEIIELYQVDSSKLEIENKIPSIQQEKELNTIFNLVEEFLERFSHRKPTMNYFSQLQQEKMHRNGLGLFSIDPDNRQSLYDFQADLPDLTDSNNSEGYDMQQARIALSNSQKLRCQIRRRFFDLAAKVKEELPLYHAGRKILISIMFEDAEEEGVEEGEWEEWIKKTLLGQQ